MAKAISQTEGAQSYTHNDEIEQAYKCLITSADGKKIVGAVRRVTLTLTVRYCKSSK
ncbi:hypothetical protein O9929_23530 [Vibrio lentus]|nr:hypothetical protein [Vibrio lentus]